MALAAFHALSFSSIYYETSDAPWFASQGLELRKTFYVALVL